jgi:hypothetical protein
MFLNLTLLVTSRVRSPLWTGSCNNGSYQTIAIDFAVLILHRKCLGVSTYRCDGGDFFSLKDEGIESEEVEPGRGCGAESAHDVGLARTLAIR